MTDDAIHVGKRSALGLVVHDHQRNLDTEKRREVKLVARVFSGYLFNRLGKVGSGSQTACKILMYY